MFISYVSLWINGSNYNEPLNYEDLIKYSMGYFIVGTASVTPAAGFVLIPLPVWGEMNGW